MKENYFSKDVQTFLLLLHRYKVRYVIVGGEAVVYYGYPRLTGDIDFFYQADAENAKRLYNVLNEFWDQDIPGVQDADELMQKSIVIQFGVPPNRIDLMNTIDSVSFDEAWDNRTIEEIEIEGEVVPVSYIGYKQIIKNKEAMSRNKDMDDLQYLRDVLPKK